MLAGDVEAIAAGISHSLLLKTDETVWATGKNDFGQLGDGANDDINTFVQVLVGTWDTALGNTLSTRTTFNKR